MDSDEHVPIGKLDGSLLSPLILFAFLVNVLDAGLTGRHGIAVNGGVGRGGVWRYADIAVMKEIYKRHQ